ncbi:PREDICTED: verprolin-like isoform X2 [Brassica oleracea var. oleracea]|uniref:verprolin-like isoform X2 n=1 Tax=Brassica oleracea var. oleracea TaxID=109376 RepID=UPI0006A7105E|nr:PREDICTED: verprolin-like isoform X2 [Brassica oleracea var. oleracea]
MDSKRIAPKDDNLKRLISTTTKDDNLKRRAQKKQTSLPTETASLIEESSGPTASKLSTTSSNAGSATIQNRSEITETNTVHVNSSVDTFQGFTILPPKKSTPPLPNYSLASQTTKPLPSPTPPKASRKTIIPLLPRSNVPPPETALDPNKSPPPLPTKTPEAPTKTWGKRASYIADKSLKRVAPKYYSEAGIPQVTVPDEVFQRGAEMHKEFIVGSFLAKMLSYQAIQSVLNFLWGKGHKLDIRTNLQERTILV